MLAIAVATFATMAISQAAPIAIPLTGTTAYDGWDGLIGGNYPGYGTFPGSSAWPNAIASNTAGTGDATLDRVEGGGGGGPYPGTSSIYFGSFLSDVYGGTLRVADATPLAGLQTLVLQIEIGSGFFEDSLPALTLNGLGGTVAPDFSGILNAYQNGTFTDPETGEELPVYVNTYGLQWDLSGIADPITSFSIDFGAAVHSQVYALQLDQSDSGYSTSVVPEPGSLGLLGAGSLLLLAGRRRLRRAGGTRSRTFIRRSALRVGR